MSNVLFGTPNYLDDGILFTPSLSGGDWSDDLPLANLKHRSLSRVARSEDAELASTQLTADLGVARPVRMVGCPKHNLSLGAKWRVRGSDSPLAADYDPMDEGDGVFKFRAADAVGDDGDPLGSWVDGSPASDPLLASGSARPTIRRGGGPNGSDAIEFNGSSNWMQVTNSRSVEHIFVVGMYDGATFPNSAGLLTERNSPPLIKGDTGGTATNFEHDTSDTFPLKYRKNGTEYDNTVTWPAPMGGVYAVMEFIGHNVTNWTDWVVQVGEERDTGAFWDGKICEIIGFSSEKTGDALTRIRNYLDVEYISGGGGGEATYDSGWLDVFPEECGLDDEQLAEDRAKGVNYGFVHVLPEATDARYWTIEIDDSENPDEYVELARLFIAGAWQPTMNAEYGLQLGVETTSSRSESDGGAAIYDERPRRRWVAGVIGHLPEAEAFEQPFEIQRRLGTTKQIYFIFDPEDAVHLHRRNFLAVSRELSPIEFPYFALHSTAFSLVEEL